jgi:hypothetical protein
VHLFSVYLLRINYTFGRPRRRLEDNIRMDLREVRRKVVDWMHVAQDRDHWQALVNNSNELSGSIKGGEFFE